MKQQQQKTARKMGRQRTRNAGSEQEVGKKGALICSKVKKKKVVSRNRMRRRDTSMESHHKKYMKRNVKERKQKVTVANEDEGRSEKEQAETKLSLIINFGHNPPEKVFRGESRCGQRARMDPVSHSGLTCVLVPP